MYINDNVKYICMMQWFLDNIKIEPSKYPKPSNNKY